MVVEIITLPGIFHFGIGSTSAKRLVKGRSPQPQGTRSFQTTGASHSQPDPSDLVVAMALPVRSGWPSLDRVRRNAAARRYQRIGFTVKAPALRLAHIIAIPSRTMRGLPSSIFRLRAP
jgi:hypothetical protein